MSYLFKQEDVFSLADFVNAETKQKGIELSLPVSSSVSVLPAESKEALSLSPKKSAFPLISVQKNH